MLKKNSMQSYTFAVVLILLKSVHLIPLLVFQLWANSQYNKDERVFLFIRKSNVRKRTVHSLASPFSVASERI